MTDDRSAHGSLGWLNDGPNPNETAYDDDAADYRDDNGRINLSTPFLIGIGIALAAILVCGLLWWLHSRQYESTDDAFIDAHIVRLSSKVSGQLTWVSPADNRHVRPGQLLAIIEPAGPQAQRDQALAAVAQAESELRQAEGQLLAARANRGRAAAETTGLAAASAKAQGDLRRYQALAQLDRAAVAESQLDASRAEAQNRASQLLAAKQQSQSNQADIVVAERQVDAARAALKAAQAKVRQIDVVLGDLKIRAPVSGQVVNRAVSVGSYVQPGTQLMAIVPDFMWVTANFKETQLTHMAPGQPVQIRVDAFPSIDFEGHVDSIQRGAGQAFGILPPQNATGNYVKVVQRVPVRILIDRPDPRRWSIGPGMSVTPSVKVR